MQQQNKTMSAAVGLSIGTASALITKTASYPVYRVQVLLQTQAKRFVFAYNTLQNQLLINGRLSSNYKGIVDCISTVYKAEGLASFWRGNVINLVGYFPQIISNFLFRDTFKKLFPLSKDKDGYSKWFMGNLLVGAASGWKYDLIGSIFVQVVLLLSFHIHLT